MILRKQIPIAFGVFAKSEIAKIEIFINKNIKCTCK